MGSWGAWAWWLFSYPTVGLEDFFVEYWPVRTYSLLKVPNPVAEADESVQNAMIDNS
jgi:hypothetical protein